MQEEFRNFEFPEENEFDTANRLSVEEFLKSMGLHEVKGIGMKAKPPPCGPKITLTSTNELDAALRLQNPNATRVLECTSTVKGCFCCCTPTSLSLQNMVLKWGEDEVLSFTYRPQIWICRGIKSQTADVFVPQRGESIGSVAYGPSFTSDTVIIDHISQSIFIASMMKPNMETSKPLPGFQIKDKHGNQVATAQTTRAFTYRGEIRYTDFEMIFSPVTIIESASAKAVLIVAFTMWVIAIKEEDARFAWFPLLTFIFLVLVGLLVAFATS
ncbi:unnamed protein product [Orchesella dallaii]|uniref:Phospholipid scramblase n=1 Tax=Orchesella dallaii TaxID=48710 RepID=A0ABP1R272_9HEXA